MSGFALKVDDFHPTEIGGGSLIERRDYRSALPDGTGGSVLNWSQMLERYSVRRHKYPLWSALVDGRCLEAVVYYSNGFWVAENDDYNVSVYGESVAEALDEAKEALSYLYNELVNESDDVLSEYSKVLKARYQRITFQ